MVEGAQRLSWRGRAWAMTTADGLSATVANGGDTTADPRVIICSCPCGKSSHIFVRHNYILERLGVVYRPITTTPRCRSQRT
eukprot:4361523-Pyramimonas_sp.AAC.1